MDSIAFISDHSVTAGLSALVVFLTLVSYHYYYNNVFSYWTKRNLKGPTPWPIAGNSLDMILKNRVQRTKSWRLKYGKLYGAYETDRPILVVADADVMRQVCIREFDKFPNHEEFRFANETQKRFIFNLKDDDWRKVRSLMSPTFTSGKMKRMFKLLDVCADDLVELFREQLDVNKTTGSEINLKESYSMYTMDGIASCCYGLKLDRQGSVNLETAAKRNEFVKLAMKIFTFDIKRILVFVMFNERFLKWIGFDPFPKDNSEAFMVRVRSLVENRRRSKRKFDDYLQILLDANLDNKMDLSEMDTKENHHAGLTEQTLIDDQERMVASVKTSALNGDDSRKLSDGELLSNALFILVVGLETTASLLTFCTYALAYNREVQQRLYEEVKAMAELDEKKGTYTFDYDAITSCDYLDSVLSETLRRFPPVLQTDRKPKVTFHIDKYNVDVGPDAKLILDLYQIMSDPDYWHDPERFDPERFMPGNRDLIVPGSYCPFGIGPRHCVGMRFSLTEAKVGLSKILMNYEFEPVEGLKYPPDPITNLGLNGIKKPLVRFKLRKND